VAYLLTNNNYRTGVDFTKKKMVIKPIRLSWEQHRKLKAEATNFFDKNLNDRYFYRENVGGLLIPSNSFKPK
jgi:hypothetical protein